jgi:hypothetical protein
MITAALDEAGGNWAEVADQLGNESRQPAPRGTRASR